MKSLFRHIIIGLLVVLVAGLVSASALTCTPNAKVCDGISIKTCNALGTGYNSIAKICLGDCKDGVCTNTAPCEKGATKCLSTMYLGTCKDTGIGYTYASCGAGKQCVNGVCEVKVADNTQTTCTPGDKLCAPDKSSYIECGVDGKTISLVTCGPGQQCADGACIAQPMCQPNFKMCIDGNIVGECNIEGTSFKVTNCQAGTQCYEGNCIPPKEEVYNLNIGIMGKNNAILVTVFAYSLNKFMAESNGQAPSTLQTISVIASGLKDYLDNKDTWSGMFDKKSNIVKIDASVYEKYKQSQQN